MLKCPCAPHKCPINVQILVTFFPCVRYALFIIIKPLCHCYWTMRMCIEYSNCVTNILLLFKCFWVVLNAAYKLSQQRYYLPSITWLRDEASGVYAFVIGVTSFASHSGCKWNSFGQRLWQKSHQYPEYLGRSLLNAWLWTCTVGSTATSIVLLYS